MKNKNTLILGILGVTALFVFAVHFDFVGAKSAPPSSSSITVNIKKPKKKKSPKISKQKGTWRVVKVQNGPGPDGPFTPSTAMSLGDYAFDITFKGQGLCTTHWKDPMDETKPHCEESLIFQDDGTFSFGRLQAFGGFMRWNNSQLEFIEGGMGGYTKFVLGHLGKK